MRGADLPLRNSLGIDHESHSHKVPKQGEEPHPPLRSPRHTSQFLHAPVSLGAAASPGMRTHHRTPTSGWIALASPGLLGSRPAPAFEGAGRPPAPRAPGLSSDKQRGNEQPPMPWEGRVGHQRRGKGVREGGTKERRRGRGSDGGGERGAGWSGMERAGQARVGGCGEGVCWESPGSS